MNKFERHQQTQVPRRRRPRVKLGRRRDPGTTAKKKARVLTKVNERVLKLEAEVQGLKAKLAEFNNVIKAAIKFCEGWIGLPEDVEYSFETMIEKLEQVLKDNKHD